MNYNQENEFYFSYGITTIPCAGKKPLKNVGYQQSIEGPTAGIQPDYGQPDGLAALCGSYSSGLHLLDFDLKNAYGIDLFEEYMNLLGADNPTLKSFLVAFRTVSGGYKIPFFVEKNFRTEALAKNDKGKPTIELQGEKALSMLPPSVYTVKVMPRTRIASSAAVLRSRSSSSLNEARYSHRARAAGRGPEPLLTSSS